MQDMTPERVGDPVVVYLDGLPVSKSKNLRGIRAYASKHRVDRVEISKKKQDGWTRGVLRVLYSNGATVVTLFSDYSVLVEFCANRRYWPEAVEL